MSADTQSTADLLRDRLDFVVGAAARAVSVHNTQPWRFRVVDDRLELLADRERQLTATDPRGREMLLSCGAALYNARLAIRALGAQPSVALFPVPGEADLLARLTVIGRGAATAEERQMFAAIPHRHTHRSEFTPKEVPRDLLVAVQAAVIEEGAGLHFVERPGSRRALSDVVTAADRAQRTDAAIVAETAAWTAAPGQSRADGVPPLAYPAHAGPERAAFPIRDFAAGRGWGSGEPGDVGTNHPVAVLTTVGDQPTDWLVAGQALERMLLLAATRWIFAAMFSQPLESPAARVLVRDEVGTPDFPQMIVQLGHAPVAPATPRRPVGDVTENAAEPTPGSLSGA
jgi:nitroreductase